MPSLVYNAGEFSSETEAAPEQKKIDDSIRRMRQAYNPRGRRAMWIGVVLIAGAMLFMWGWSVFFQITSLNWSESTEAAFVKHAKNSWNTAVESARTRTIIAPESQEKLTEMATLIASSTASSTLTVSTSTVGTTTTVLTSTTLLTTSTP